MFKVSLRTRQRGRGEGWGQTRPDAWEMGVGPDRSRTVATPEVTEVCEDRSGFLRRSLDTRGLLLRWLFLHHPRLLCSLPFHSGTEDTAGDRRAALSQLHPLRGYVPVCGHGGEDVGGLYKEPRSTNRQVFSQRASLAS